MDDKKRIREDTDGRASKTPLNQSVRIYKIV